MCALVLAMRKVPILGPGGGGAPLGDPNNPAYSVAVSNAEAASWREKAAKDADAARLYPASASVFNKVTSSDSLRCRGKSQAGEEQEVLASTPETTAADASNTIRPSEGLLRDNEEHNNFGIAESGNLAESAANTTLQPRPEPSTSSLALNKSGSGQGRRKPELTVMSQSSNAGEGSVLDMVPTHSSRLIQAALQVATSILKLRRV